ncbi:MAG: SDR family oxidoreductase [Novosphingobium meiothermophilum]
MSKTIVITGAGAGLGRAVARRLAADGDTLILLGRTLAKVEELATELGAPHYAVECDVSDPESVRRAFATISARTSRIDVLVNNAAVFEPFTLAAASDAQILSHLMINLAGPLFCSREALPLFNGRGHIINVSSESVHLRMRMLWMYAATKAGLEFASETLARELEADNVRVTVVRAGQMMDETKTAPGWPMDVAVRFAQENAAIGLNLRERPISHYDSVAAVFRQVIDSPHDLHIGAVHLSARRP